MNESRLSNRDRRSSGRPVTSEILDRLPPQDQLSERSLLGSVIVDPRTIDEVVSIVTTEDFYSDANRIIFSQFVKLFEARQKIDPIELINRLKAEKLFDQVGGNAYIAELAQSSPSAANAAYYARAVRSTAIQRRLILSATEILRSAYEERADVEGLVQLAEAKILEVRDLQTESDPTTLANVLVEIGGLFEKRAQGLDRSGKSSGFGSLDLKLGSFRPREFVVIAARPSMGKAQPLDASILLQSGEFVPIGHLKIGDSLASIDGNSSEVVGIYPQGKKQVFRVTLSDGRSAECCEDHLWKVNFRKWSEPKVLATKTIREMLGRSTYRGRLFIDPASGHYGEKSLSLDPWILGYLIGNGSNTNSTPRVSTAFKYCVEKLAVCSEDLNLTLAESGKYDFRISQPDRWGGDGTLNANGTRRNKLREKLEEFGLWGKTAEQKTIPAIVFECDFETRRQVLCGLIESDGWVEKFGAIRYSSASKELARQVVQLMRSLGGSGRYTKKETSYTYRGKKRRGLPAYVCGLQHPRHEKLGIGGEKGERLSPRKKIARLNIESIEPTRIAECQCIEVSHSSRLYITDDFIPTHNTAFALNTLAHLLDSGATCLMLSLEMSRIELCERLLSSYSFVPLKSIRANRALLPEEASAIVDAQADMARWNLSIDDNPRHSISTIASTARRFKRRHGLDVLVVDYLQLIQADEYSKGTEYERITAITRRLKMLAGELDATVAGISQVGRGAEGKPTLAHLKGSGSIEQDADVVLFVHRPHYFDPELDPTLAEIIVAKQRNGPTGTANLRWDKDCVRFYEPEPEDGGDWQEYLND